VCFRKSNNRRLHRIQVAELNETSITKTMIIIETAIENFLLLFIEDEMIFIKLFLVNIYTLTHFSTLYIVTIIL